ncbi:response regulator transcription factor [Myceligenerans xiligouense]|uniref:Response regulator receiver domain-containing protein n=1 Tax=Myceligenerans xiligouense TaxID=253184 RepID=A0A3N4YI77_9MICO|nr:response regulator transcription factor [Myceligenerans xiligouense]RPF20829.1 response regulator receiver domain-containing protein [Myceligenerans xiligouense]
MTDVTTAPSPASETTAGGTTPSGPAPRILLYSDDRTVREQVRLAVGPRISADAPQIVWHEAATPAAVVDAADSDRWDLLVLDGEADKSGGMGLCRQLKNELYECPPVLVLTGRPQDSWLASWSQADGTVTRPLDPIAVQAAVANLL